MGAKHDVRIRSSRFKRRAGARSCRQGCHRGLWAILAVPYLLESTVTVVNKIVFGVTNRVIEALIVSAFVSSAVLAQPVPPEILISPGTPTSTDIVHITVNTFAFCYVSGPTNGITTAITGSTIQITAILTCTGLTTPPPPLSFSQDVGPLPPGTYQVRYSANTSASPPGLLATITFQVIGVAAAIPTLDKYAMILLMMLVTLIGLKIRHNQNYVSRKHTIPR
jgi:hypothetical protein